MGSPTDSWANEPPFLLCPPPPGDDAAHSPAPACRALINIFSSFFDFNAPSVTYVPNNKTLSATIRLDKKM
jgi:hypothetical protein